MTTDEKFDWLRANWKKLKESGKLEIAVTRLIDQDPFLKEHYTSQDIIDLEESIDNAYDELHNPATV